MVCHGSFVSSLSFISSPDYPTGYVLSGGGDSTVGSLHVCMLVIINKILESKASHYFVFSLQVRLWDYISGSLLDTCEVGAKVR